jgi:hypothetical protein
MKTISLVLAVETLPGVGKVHIDEIRCGRVTHGGDGFKIRCGLDVGSSVHIPRAKCADCLAPDDHHAFVPGVVILEVHPED